MKQFYTGVQKIRNISATPLAVATLPGMDLMRYSPRVWFKLQPLQPILDSAIVEKNRQIRGLNRLGGMTTPNLAYPVHRCMGHGGKYYAHYALLGDGLHPSTYLTSRCSEEIIEYCAAKLGGVYHVQAWIPNQLLIQRIQDAAWRLRNPKSKL